MSELLKGIERAHAPTPRDSALGVIVRRRADGWHVLLGKRSRQSRFMPGHLAFPGGTLDPEDRPEEPGALVPILLVLRRTPVVSADRTNP